MAVDVGQYLPNVDIGKGFIIQAGTWFIFIVLIAIGLGLFTWFIIRRTQFKYTIRIFEKIAGRVEPTRKDRAMEVRLRTTGDTVLYLSKHKKYLPAPTIQTGRKVYWYYIGEDREWRNIGIEDIDTKMKTLGIHMTDRDMRYARVALQRNLKDRYETPTFLQKYGGLLAYTGLIAITVVGLWLLLDKGYEIVNSADQVLKASEAVMDQAAKVLSGLDNVCSGSGIAPA